MISNERLKVLLDKADRSARARDDALAKLSEATTASNDEVDRAVDYVHDSFASQLSSVSEQAAKMATQVQVAGRGAEASHNKVRAMDRRLDNVRAALDVVQAVVKQRTSVARVSTAVDAGEFETAVDCIVQFDSVSRILSNFPRDNLRAMAKAQDDAASDASNTEPSTMSFGDDSSGEPQSPLGADQTVSRARTELHDALMSSLRDAVKANLEPSVSRFSSMLAKIGFVEEGCNAFTDFIVETVKNDLKSFVESALNDVNLGKTTHLIACVSVLDRIAAAMERHKPFMDSTFPGRANALILALHSQATHHCVDVLRDFLATRRGVVGKAGKSKESAKRIDPRSLDQTLEDISHLLTCCHQYLKFVSSCVEADGESASAEVRAKIQDSPLLREVGGLMNIYVPVQSDYLQAAFQVIVSQCDEHIAQKLQPLRSQLEPSGDQAGRFPGTGIMTSLWGANAPASPSSTGAKSVDMAVSSPRFRQLLDEIDVTLVEDLFHVLLVALRRACGTHDITIASATVNSVTGLVSEQLLPELRKRLTVDDEAERDDNEVARRVSHRLRAKWLRAAHNAAEYVNKLGLDFEQTAASQYSGKDLFRLTEQKHDFTQSSVALRDLVQHVAKQLGALIADQIVCSAGQMFDTASHVLQTESAYVNAGLTDTWVTACRPVLEDELQDLVFPFPEEVRDEIVAETCNAVVSWLVASIPKKSFDSFGALQLDREVRDLRNLFNEKTDTPIRERFAQLLAMTAVLMAESAQDAVAEARGRVEDPAALFARRVDCGP